MPTFARQLLPLRLRIWGRQAEMRLRVAASASATRRVTMTPVPLDRATVAGLEAVFSEEAASPVTGAPDFPDEALLPERWEQVHEVVASLTRYNRPDDKYYDWSRMQRRLDVDPAFLSKDLFVSWLADTHGPRRILEIGVRTGRSLAVLVASHPDPATASIVAIDPFVEMGSPRVVRRNAERAAGRPLSPVFLVGFSERLVPALVDARPDLRFDYVLVDGSHVPSDALADLRLIEPLVAQGGYVLFDDIGDETYGLLPVWEEWLAGTCGAFVQRTYEHGEAFAVARRR